MSTLHLEIDAILTMEARRLISRGQTDGTSLRVDQCVVGRGGFNPHDYLAAIPVNPDVYALTEPVFSTAITRVEFPNQNAIACYCLFEAIEANETLGEIGIIGEVQNSPGDPVSGTTILMAVGNFPLIAKNDTMRYVLRITVQA